MSRDTTMPSGTHSVAGEVDPVFAAVRRTFAGLALGRGGAAVAAYVDGEKVVDLWGGWARDDRPWTRDTLVLAMSATKGVAALCIQMLSDRGLIDPEERVATYWPEFAAAGKQDILVRHVMNHTAGVIGIDHPEEILDWSGRGWDDYDAIAQRVAASAPSWEPGTKIGYHAVSIGWLTQELVRRTTGDTLGTFVANEIAAPLGLDLHIGTPADAQPRVADIVQDDPSEIGFKGRAIRKLLVRAVSDPESLTGRSAIAMPNGSILTDMDRLNAPWFKAIELPSANGCMDARSLARMYAVLAQGGELDGVRLVSPESIAQFGSLSFSGDSAMVPKSSFWRAILPSTQMRYALGYEGDFGQVESDERRFGPNPTAFGHLGAGGQIGFADPERRVSFAFLRNHHSEWEASTALVASLYACL